MLGYKKTEGLKNRLLKSGINQSPRCILQKGSDYYEYLNVLYNRPICFDIYYINT